MNPRFSNVRQELAKRPDPVVRLAFAQIEELLGHALPDAGERSPTAWWTYRDISSVDVGGPRWQTKVDYVRRDVVFARIDAQTPTGGAAVPRPR